MHKSREKNYVQRALVILYLLETQSNVTEVAHRVRAAQSSVHQWQSSRSVTLRGCRTVTVFAFTALLAAGSFAMLIAAHAVEDDSAARETIREPTTAESDHRRTWRDCDECPELVLIPAGTYIMGSPQHEKGRYRSEGPQRQVRIGKPFAVGVYEVTRKEFSRFVSEVGHPSGDSCETYEDGEWSRRSGRSWEKPGFSQTSAHPVVCVNWKDAQAYVGWLSERTGKEYRLLSEAEWEYAARGRTETSRYWGDDPADACVHENVADYTAKEKYSGGIIHDCQDGAVHTSEVGRYKPNAFGLHDMLGNVMEWVADCRHASYDEAPTDGKAWIEGRECTFRMLRGGSWSVKPRIARSAVRQKYPLLGRLSEVGFRVARTIDRELKP